MPTENGALTPEEKFKPKLPKQLQEQVDAVNAQMTAQPQEQEQEPEVDQFEEDQSPDSEEEPRREEGAPPQREEQSGEKRARSAIARLEQSLQANQALSRRVGELENQISTGKLRAPAPAAEPPKPRERLIKADEIDDYGDEFFDIVGRRAREEFVPEIETLAQRIARLEDGQKNVSQVIDRTQQRSVYDMLADDVPDWNAINHMPEFKTWLSYPDPYSGRVRHEMLQEAFSRHDGNRVVNFFRGFAEAAGLPLNPPDEQSSAPPPANGSGSGKPSLEQFAAPGRARSAPQNLPPEKPVYSRAWIAQFSDAKIRGLYRGREAEAEAIERDIFQAQHEGRIQ